MGSHYLGHRLSWAALLTLRAGGEAAAMFSGCFCEGVAGGARAQSLALHSPGTNRQPRLQRPGAPPRHLVQCRRRLPARAPPAHTPSSRARGGPQWQRARGPEAFTPLPQARCCWQLASVHSEVSPTPESPTKTSKRAQIKHERGEVTTDTTETEKRLRKCCGQLDDLEGVDKFLEALSLPRMEKKQNVRTQRTNEMESVSTNSQ